MRKHSRPRWDRTVPLKLGTLTTVENAHNTALTRSTACIPSRRFTVKSKDRRTDATAFESDQSSEKETDLHLREQDGLRHCLQQARKKFERDEERVEQDDELERAPTNRRKFGGNDTKD